MPSEGATPANRPSASEFLPHVQGLRAIAVMAVIIYHFWPWYLPGGYVGVDVFFVISGFLITAHLARELEQTGTIRLGQFWARRARRLLPAALLVLAFCAFIASNPYLTPTSSLPTELREIVASALYVENLQLAVSSTDYLARTGGETLTQHYWSLSLEEQFYALWPLLLLGVAWFGRRRLRAERHRAVIVAIGIVSMLSLAFCVYFTAAHPGPAYFVPLGRMWEFGIGAMVGLIPALRVHHRWGAFVLGWAGVLAILASAVLFSGETAFPGYTALLPTLGAAAVLASRAPARGIAANRFLSMRVAQITGDLSYSLYLWHWPFLLAAAQLVPTLSGAHRLGLVALTFAAAWLTKRFVEDPVRRFRPLVSRRPLRTFIASAAATSLVVGLAGTAWAVNAATYRDGVRAIADLQANPRPCLGAAVILDPSCDDTRHRESLPPPGFAGTDIPDHDECLARNQSPRLIACDFGSTKRSAPRVLLVGDSHAYQWLPTLTAISKRHGWHLRTYVRGACPWSAAELPGTTPCAEWQRTLRASLAREPADVIVTSAYATTNLPGYARSIPAAATGFRTAWREATARGTSVIAIADNPRWPTSPNKCLLREREAACAGPQEAMLGTDPLLIAGKGQPRVSVLDFSAVFCQDGRCPAVIGGATAYSDPHHLTVTMANSLAPQLTSAIRDALGQPSGTRPAVR